jgi:hypothetical protein
MMDLGYEPTVTAGDTIVITVQKSWFTGAGTATGSTFRAGDHLRRLTSSNITFMDGSTHCFPDGGHVNSKCSSGLPFV